MKGDRIPSDHTVGKHCQPNELVQEEDAYGNLVATGVRGEAFIPDDDGVSVGWLEQHEGSREQQIRSMVSCMQSSRTVRKSHRLALLSVGVISECGSKTGYDVWVEHDPAAGFDCHSLIVGIDPKRKELMELIAAEILSLEVMLA